MRVLDGLSQLIRGIDSEIWKFGEVRIGGIEKVHGEALMRLERHARAYWRVAFVAAVRKVVALYAVPRLWWLSANRDGMKGEQPSGQNIPQRGKGA